VTAQGNDTSGGDVLYTFAANNFFDPPIIIGPQLEQTAVFFLGEAAWTIIVTTDDDPLCPDQALDYS
jgi:hypothetical protein